MFMFINFNAVVVCSSNNVSINNQCFMQKQINENLLDKNKFTLIHYNCLRFFFNLINLNNNCLIIEYQVDMTVHMIKVRKIITICSRNLSSPRCID